MDGTAQFSNSVGNVDSLPACRRRTREAANWSVDDQLWMGRDFPAIDTGAAAARPVSGHKAADPAAAAPPGQAAGAPVANPLPDQTFLEDEAWSFQLPVDAFTDPDGDPLTLTATLSTGDPLPDWLTFDASSRTFTGVPPRDFNGQLSILVTASDGESAVSSGFSLSVLPVNDAPVANSLPDRASPEDQACSFQLPKDAFTDPDGDPLIVTATLANGDALPDWLTFDAGTRTFTGTPPRDFNGALSILVTASDGESATSSPFSLSITPVNDGPVVTLAPIYASDFESPDEALWFTTIGGDSPIPLPHEDDGTGNMTLVSAGPWWTDLNHVTPGTGQLHLPSTLYVNGSNGGIVIDDFRDLTFSFDIKAEGLQIPEGAHIYLWFQAMDPTLPWGVGQYVNYVNVSVPVEELLIDGEFAHVSITLSQVEADWLALGSSLDREGVYSQSSSIVTALSGIPVGLGLVIFMGNEPSGPPASGLIRLDNVVLSHGDVIRLKFAPEALAGGLQPLHLDVAVTDPDSSTFENYRLSVGYQGVGLSGEELGLAFPGGGDLTTVDGILYLGAEQIGTVAGGSNGSALLIEITAPVDSAVISDVINAIAYGNNDAGAGATRDLVVTLDDEPGRTASFAVEVSARLPLDDGSGNDHLIGTGANEALNGGLGTDRLEGAAGDDRLDGGTGDDILHGGSGDDWFHVDSVGDIVSESIGEGSQDRIFASVSYVLAAGAEVEILTTIFNAGLEPIDLTGNELANTIYGNAGANRLEGGAGKDALIGNEDDDILDGGTGNDILDGGTGSDILRGGIGDDWHFVDSAGDILIEAVGEGTLDRVFASASYTLSAGAEIELMSTTLHIGLDAINLIGNELANAIYGNAGANRLEGGAGNDALIGNEGDDILDGGTGNDILRGGIGRDTFLFSQDTGTDRIMDFSVAGSDHDLIALPGLRTGTLAAFITEHVSQIGADTMISWNGAELILVNVNASTLLPDHFVLG